MATTIIGRAMAAFAIASTFTSSPTAAQIGNEPFQFHALTPFASSAGGAGMGPAYRQAILQQNIDRRQPDIFLSDPAGNLLEVPNLHRQAFPRQQANSFIDRQPGTGFGIGIGGIGIGWSSAPGPEWAASYPAYHSVPIDTWVRQLDTIQPIQRR